MHHLMPLRYKVLYSLLTIIITLWILEKILGTSFIQIQLSEFCTEILNSIENGDEFEYFEILKFRAAIALFFVALIFLLAKKPIFSIVWAIHKGVKKLVGERIYPNLNGKWEVCIESNYGVIKAIEETVNSERHKAYDLQSPKEFREFKANHEDQIVLGTAEIKANFLTISMKMTMNLEGRDYAPTSYTLACLPIETKENGKQTFKLSYTYEQENIDIGSKAYEDQYSHQGAAYLQLLDVNDGHELHLHGVYWTARNWERSANTAGIITLKRKNDWLKRLFY